MKIERTLNRLEIIFSTAAAIPIVGTPAGVLKISMGIIQAVSSLAISILFAVPALLGNDFSRKISQHCWEHFKHGMANVGMGCLELIPFLGTGLYFIRQHRATYDFHFFPYESLVLEDQLNQLHQLPDINQAQNLLEKYCKEHSLEEISSKFQYLLEVTSPLRSVVIAKLLSMLKEKTRKKVPGQERVQNFLPRLGNYQGEIIRELICQGDLPQLQLLIKIPADLKLKDLEGSSLLYLASYFGKKDIVKFLIERGCEIDAKSHQRTPLMAALANGHFEVCKVLIDNGASLSISCEGTYPLGFAKLDRQLVDFIISLGKKNDPLYEDGWTLLHLATYKGKEELVSYLLEQGLDINAKAKDGNTPLILASRYAHHPIVKTLLEQGADPSIWTVNGRRAIHFSYYHDDDKVLKELLPFESCQKHLLSKIYEKQRMFCSRFALDCNFKNATNEFIEFSGGPTEIGVKEVLVSIRDFVTRQKKLSLPSSQVCDWSEVFTIFSHSLKNRHQIHHAFDASAPDIISIPLDWSNEDSGHGVGIVISKELNLLIKCNKGDGVDLDSAGLIVYKINRNESLEEVLNEVLTKPSSEREAFFSNELHEKLELEVQTILLHKPQLASHCLWASHKIMIQAIAYLILLRSHQFDEAEKLSRQFYKEWYEDDLWNSFQDFKQTCENIEEWIENKEISKEELRKERIFHLEFLNALYIKYALKDTLTSTQVAIFDDLLSNQHLLKTKMKVEDLRETYAKEERKLLLKTKSKTLSKIEQESLQASIQKKYWIKTPLTL